MSTDELAFHMEMMALALEEARKCTPKQGAFSVGCVLVSRAGDPPPFVVARGFSRELPGNTHAEANALEKARNLTKEDLSSLISSDRTEARSHSVEEILRSSDVYTTMEPCSVRTSGLAPCADALIEAKVRRCIIGVSEPEDYVVCEGARKLIEAGIDVIWLKGMEEQCLAVARHGLEQ